MGEKLELPDGQWAIIRDEGEVTERQRRILRHALPAAARLQLKIDEAALREKQEKHGFVEVAGEAEAKEDDDPWTNLAFYGPEEMDALWDLQAAHIVAYVSAWSLGPPPTMETVIDLPGAIFDVLAAHTFSRPGGTVDMTPEGGLDDPESPTVPSQSSSDDSGAEEALSLSTPTSSNDGESIGTVDSTV